MTHPALRPPWLTLIGIGEDGRGGLSPRATAALAQAETVVGGARHLALVAPLACRTMGWPTPIDDAVPHILALRGTPTVVLATGDPFHYGVGTLLSRHVSADEIGSFPQPSAFSLAASRLCWTLQDVIPLSLHGRDARVLPQHLAPGARILILSWDGSTPALVAGILRERGFGRSEIVVLERMGGPAERRQDTTAAGFALTDIDGLNTIAVRCIADDGVLPLSRTCLPDSAFEHDGQITKQSLRAIAMAALAPVGDETLWDIGAGAGSVGIEWLRAASGNRAYAVEKAPERAARIARNAAHHRVRLDVVEGAAPAALAGLPAPDAIFIGGGTGDAAIVDAAIAGLRDGGRLVANAVTLDGQGLLIRMHATHGGDLAQFQYSDAAPVGRFHAWRPAMPVVQWRWSKPQ